MVKNKIVSLLPNGWKCKLFGQLDSFRADKALASFLFFSTGFEIEIIQSSNSLEVYSVFHQETQRVLSKLN